MKNVVKLKIFDNIQCEEVCQTSDMNHKQKLNEKKKLKIKNHRKLIKLRLIDWTPLFKY